MANVYAPQPGPQTAFLASTADVCVFGSGAGTGKTYALQLEAVRHHDVPGFTGLILRRKTPQLENPGGLWDSSRQILLDFGGRLRAKPTYDCRFPSGAYLKFSHLEKVSDTDNYQGAELTFIGLEEATQFVGTQITYMLSRNRSSCGVRPYMRMTCNPDPDSFVAELVDWYLDEEGYPHPDKSGLVRFFAQEEGGIIWGASRDEVVEQSIRLQDQLRDGVAAAELVLSFSFIPAKLEDNPALMKKDPGYRAKLEALSYVDRMRLLGGNWRIRENAGTMFREEWFEFADEAPADARRIRYWDLAGSKRRRSDCTAGVLMAEKGGRYFVLDAKNQKGRPHETERLIRTTAEVDGPSVEVHIEQEAGAGAAIAIDHYQRNVLKGFAVYGHQVRGQGTKIERAKPYSSSVEAGNVVIVRGAWNKLFLAQHEAFPDGAKDDLVDGGSGAHNQLGAGHGFYARAAS